MPKDVMELEELPNHITICSEDFSPIFTGLQMMKRKVLLIGMFLKSAQKSVSIKFIQKLSLKT
jgi:hypothetical protein